MVFQPARRPAAPRPGNEAMPATRPTAPAPPAIRSVPGAPGLRVPTPRALPPRGRGARPGAAAPDGRGLLRRGRPFVGVAAFLALAAVAFSVRAEDPLSTRVLGAEDPFTHVVFVKEHLARARFDDSYHLGTGLYPPGLHAFTGAFASVGGIDLYDFARLFPPILGGLAVAAVFVLGSRLGGFAAGAAAAAALAFIPEHAFRTNLLFPTTLDLFLVPAWLLALAGIVEGKRAWVAPALLLAVALGLSHPWVLPLLGLSALGYAALHAAFSGPLAGLRSRIPGALIAAAIIMGLSALAAVFRWDTGGESSFATLLGKLPATLPKHGPLLLGLAAGATAAGIAVYAAHRLLEKRGLGWATPVVGALLLAAGLAVALPRLTAHTPEFVNYPRMLGRPMILLAIAGVVALPLARSRAGWMAAGIVLVTFPLTAINFFESRWWPHRTVGYLTLGVALLAGVAAATAGHGAGKLAAAAARRVGRAAPAGAFAALSVVVALAVVAPVVAAQPRVYDWYRLYKDDQFAAFEWAAAEMERDPSASFVSGDWHANLILKTLAQDMGRVGFRRAFFQSEESRRDLLEDYRSDGATVHLVLDKYTRKIAERKGYNFAFESSPAWVLVWPPGGAPAKDGVAIYRDATPRAEGSVSG